MKDLLVFLSAIGEFTRAFDNMEILVGLCLQNNKHKSDHQQYFFNSSHLKSQKLTILSYNNDGIIQIKVINNHQSHVQEGIQHLTRED